MRCEAKKPWKTLKKWLKRKRENETLNGARASYRHCNKHQGAIAHGPKKVLVIGASTGYGLASRITAAFGSKADTLGVFFEKEPESNRTASAGWYNTVAFEKAAKAEGLRKQKEPNKWQSNPFANL